MTPTVLEAACYVGLFSALWSVGAIRAYCAALPMPHRRLLGAGLVLLVTCQLINEPRRTFPLTSWAMYGLTDAPAEVVFYRYRGIRAGGEVVPIPADALFQAVGPSGFASKMRRLAEAALDDRKPRAKEKLTDWLRAIGRYYNHRHPDQPVVAVQLIRCTVPWGEQAARIAEKPVWRAELE